MKTLLVICLLESCVIYRGYALLDPCATARYYVGKIKTMSLSTTVSTDGSLLEAGWMHCRVGPMNQCMQIRRLSSRDHVDNTLLNNITVGGVTCPAVRTRLKNTTFHIDHWRGRRNNEVDGSFSVSPGSTLMHHYVTRTAKITLSLSALPGNVGYYTLYAIVDPHAVNPRSGRSYLPINEYESFLLFLQTYGEGQCHPDAFVGKIFTRNITLSSNLEARFNVKSNSFGDHRFVWKGARAGANKVFKTQHITMSVTAEQHMDEIAYSIEFRHPKEVPGRTTSIYYELADDGVEAADYYVKCVAQECQPATGCNQRLQIDGAPKVNSELATRLTPLSQQSVWSILLCAFEILFLLMFIVILSLVRYYRTR
ncbi:membrane protein A22B [Aotine betaherpesvirus 1]|uniref:Membrane protein A22B n=1 Tax=Aotine betaherpesvirus 1 TaxID=50290 RepID=G8XUI8_9BETA|nr:membrane protein A22B [Aotine betaherpesvirus 1]AEV80829.1 membrane protein A22B [Aotine betaherpesvirus 1]